MRGLSRTAVAAAVAVFVLTGAATADAAAVAKARGSTRAALVRAFVAQDGTSVGIFGVYTFGSAGVVCQKTPDAGTVRLLFSGYRQSWRYSFATRSTHRGSRTQRRLEAVCR